jgi:hypothetical protein
MAMRPVSCNDNGKSGSRKPVFQHVNVVVIVLDIENLHSALVLSNLTHLPISRLS